MDEQWTCRHVSLSNPADDGAADLPLLLRRVADLMDEEGIAPMDVMDLTVSSDMTADGPWWTVTVYWSSGRGEDDVDPREGTGVERRPSGSSARVA